MKTIANPPLWSGPLPECGGWGQGTLAFFVLLLAATALAAPSSGQSARSAASVEVEDTLAAPEIADSLRARPGGEEPVSALSPTDPTGPSDTATAGVDAAAAEVAELLRRGDDAMARLEPTAALEAYQAAVARNPSNYDALWKSGRTLIDIGELEGKGNSQKDKYNKALKYAERAVMVKPDGAEGHFVRAYALGRVALFEGGKTKIRLSKEVKSEAQRAIDLDPLNDGAYHILGGWNYNIADLNFMERTIANTVLGGVPKDASFENAAHYYQLAIEANPAHVNHHLEYARTLMKLGREDEAREELRKAVDLPTEDLDDSAHKQEARNLLAKLS